MADWFVVQTLSFGLTQYDVDYLRSMCDYKCTASYPLETFSLPVASAVRDSVEDVW